MAYCILDAAVITDSDIIQFSKPNRMASAKVTIGLAGAVVCIIIIVTRPGQCGFEIDTTSWTFKGRQVFKDFIAKAKVNTIAEDAKESCIDRSRHTSHAMSYM